MSQGGKLLMLGVGGGTASYFAYNKLKNVDLPVPEEELPNYGSTPGPFRSNLPLGKVLASWTTNYEPSVKWDDNWDRFVGCVNTTLIHGIIAIYDSP